MLLLVIGAGALVLRAIPLLGALPYPVYVDEWGVAKPAAHLIAEGTVDPGDYTYPPLLPSASALAAVALGAFGAGDPDAAPRSASPRIDVVEPWTLLLGGRLVVLATGVATVVLCGLLGRELAGHRVGLLAAAIAAVTPALTFRSSVVITDTPAACAAVACTWASAHLATGPRRLRWALVAGACAGLALAAKYHVALVGLVPLIVLGGTDLPARQRLRLAGAVVVAAAVAAVVAAPALLLHAPDVLDGIREVARNYERHEGRLATRPLWRQAVSPKELGHLLVPMVAGVAVLVRRERSRLVTVAFAAFALAEAALTLRYRFQPLRNVLALVPFACVAAAAALDAAARAVARRWRLPARAVPRLVLAGAAVVALPALAVDLHRAAANASTVDTRVEAVDWLARAVADGDSVLVADELGVLPAELERLGVPVVVAPIDEPADVADHRWVVRGLHPADAWSGPLEAAGAVERAAFGSVHLLCDPPPPRLGRVGDCPAGSPSTAWFFNDVRVVISEVPRTG